ncbi:MAG: histidine--tRNA ligase [Lactobacillales bacterium]|jgi:histidyl-tRNA synthetase|nr:histidine--tRNA ligase [Lactobacillales bacterium]
MRKSKRVQRPKGTNDLLIDEIKNWQYLEKIAQEVFKIYQFFEIRTPLFEHYEVFSRAVGDTSDIVSKEMYDFYDKGERHIALRPEGTAGVVRAFVENKLFGPEYGKPYKVYYLGPMFRYERPQAGRLRQFYQLGVEAFGSKNPATDVEIIAMLMQFFDRLELKKNRLVINSLGDKESREVYRKALIEFLELKMEQLSEDSKHRLYKNPLRVLDSKDERDKKVVADAPSILDYLNEESMQHFSKVKSMLGALEIPYEIDHRMVRGLDYYNHTIFEVMNDAILGVQTTIAAGGRYDGLVEYFGGPATPGFGFAIGVERLLMTLAAEGVELPSKSPIDVYVVSIGDVADEQSLKIVQDIRKAGFSTEQDFLGRKAKAQFKAADKLKAKLIMTVGESELLAKKIKIKVVQTQEETLISLERIRTDFATVYKELLNE